MPFPSFAVVMPTHGRGPGVEPALRSVLNQTRPSDELIVVDDASIPPTRELAPLLRSDPRIRYYYLPTNRGVCAVRNEGVRRANSDYVAFLDDDDLFAPNKLEALAAAVDRDPSLDVLYHALWVVQPREGIRYANDPCQHPFSKPEILVKNILDGGTSMLAVRRSAFLALDGFDESLPAVEDYELILRMRLADLRFGYVPGCLAEYVRNTSMHSRTLSLERDERAWAMIHEKFAAEYAALPRAAWRDHLQKIEQYRAFRCLAGYRRREAFRRFVRAFGYSPILGALPLLAAGLLALISPGAVMALQGRLKRNRWLRSVRRPVAIGSQA